MRENTEYNRQKPKEELAACEEKYRNIIENINTVVYYTNEKGIITFISQSVQNFFGYRQEEVLGKSFLEFLYEEDLLKAKNSFARLAIKKYGREELRYKSKDGKIKLVKLIHTAVFEESKFAGDMGILIDISEDQRETQSLGFQSDLLNGVREAISVINIKANITDVDASDKFNLKLIENAFHEVDRGLHKILDKSPFIFYTHTPDNIINFVGSQSKKLLGFDPKEIKTRWIELLTNNPVNQKAIELTKKAIETGIPQEPYEIEMRNNKNDVAWFEVHELPIVRDGKTVLMVGSLTDISERKKVEEELQANQSLLADALEMASMGHWEYNVTTDTFTFNDQFYKMLHTSKEEIGSYTMSSTEYVKRFFHKDDYDFVGKAKQGSIKTADPNYHKELEHRIIFADGEFGTIAVRYKIVKDGNGKTIRVYGVNQDITRRKKAEIALKEREEKLAESEKFLENIIENIPNMIFVKDAKDLKFVKMNKTGEELLGFTREELIGKNDYDFFPKDQADFFIEKDREVISSNNYLEIPDERINTRKYGERVLQTKKITIRDDKGNPKYLLGISEDITQRKREEQELLEAKEKAEEMNRLKTNFLANMSHELRTPMVGILGFAEILLEELSEPSQIEMVSTIKNSGTRLITTLNSILDLSRVEANKQDIKNAPVNLNEIIEETIRLYEPIVMSKNIYLKYIITEKNVCLNSDKDILYKIINNLINNAVKYTNQGGIVVKLIVQGTDSNKKILVEITDTGIGIPKKFHKIIFEPFRQVSEGFSREFEGTGLGLSIIKKFVEVLKGSITLKSDLGKGSTFIVTFPYTNIEQEIDSNSESTKDKNVLPNTPIKNLSVLLVEDDHSNALLICTYLKEYMNIDHVSDGQAAIRICSSKKYDAVLMDINLKGIDGVETLRQIRKIDTHYANIPVIATTAYAMLGDRERFLTLGFTNYLSKPFDRSQLLMLLKTIFKND